MQTRPWGIAINGCITGASDESAILLEVIERNEDLNVNAKLLTKISNDIFGKHLPVVSKEMLGKVNPSNGHLIRAEKTCKGNCSLKLENSIFGADMREVAALCKGAENLYNNMIMVFFALFSNHKGSKALVPKFQSTI